MWVSAQKPLQTTPVFPWKQCDQIRFQQVILNYSSAPPPLCDWLLVSQFIINV